MELLDTEGLEQLEKERERLKGKILSALAEGSDYFEEEIEEELEEASEDTEDFSEDREKEKYEETVEGFEPNKDNFDSIENN